MCHDASDPCHWAILRIAWLSIVWVLLAASCRYLSCTPDCVRYMIGNTRLAEVVTYIHALAAVAMPLLPLLLNGTQGGDIFAFGQLF